MTDEEEEINRLAIIRAMEIATPIIKNLKRASNTDGSYPRGQHLYGSPMWTIPFGLIDNDQPFDDLPDVTTAKDRQKLQNVPRNLKPIDVEQGRIMKASVIRGKSRLFSPAETILTPTCIPIRRTLA